MKEEDALNFEDACLDPHQSSLEEGRLQGQQAGALAGFREGQELGQSKGVELGLEVGFYKGVCQALQAMYESNHNADSNSDGAVILGDRIAKSLQHFQAAIDDFSTPDDVFRVEDDKVDLVHQLQRIRARFKLVMVQLGHPQFSLKQVLQQTPSIKEEGDLLQTNGEEQIVDHEW